MGKAILFLCAWSFIINVSSLLFQPFYHNSNPIFHIYTIVDFSILLYIYFQYLNSLNWRRFIIFLWVFFTIISLNYFFQEMWEINTIPSIMSKLTMVFISVYCLNFQYKSKQFDLMTSDYFFWINTAILLYNGCTMYISIFEVFIREKDDLVLYYTWPFQLIITILFNLILTKGIWKMIR